jgi:hypothetical protein
VVKLEHMRTGLICFLGEKFGFIREDASGRRFFVYPGSMVSRAEWHALNEGDGVVFDSVPVPDRPNDQAVAVVVTRRRYPAGLVQPRRPSLRNAEPWQRTLAAVAREAATG